MQTILILPVLKCDYEKWSMKWTRRKCKVNVIFTRDAVAVVVDTSLEKFNFANLLSQNDKHEENERDENDDKMCER